MIDSFTDTQKGFLEGMYGGNVKSVGERLMQKGRVGKVFGRYMVFLERLFRALDHITSTSTVEGLKQTAAALSPKIH